MASINRPTKEQVRQWMVERRQGGQPPPTCEEIRLTLGWAYRAPETRPTNPTHHERVQ